MRAILAKLLEWNDKGLWSYPWQNENDFAKWLSFRAATDLSNTQYAVLGLRWIPPEQREDRGEVETARLVPVTEAQA